VADTTQPDMAQPRDAWHWLRHRWTRWSAYTVRRRVKATEIKHDGGNAMDGWLSTTVTATPVTRSFTEYRETRSCLTCGKTQDREIRNG
jgi:hypothetical protein